MVCLSVVVCLFVAVCLFACCCLVVGMFVVVCLILAIHEWKCGCRCDSTCRRTKIKRIIAYPFVRFSVSLPARPPALCLGTLMVQKPSSGNPMVHRIMLRQLCIKNSLGMQRCKTCAWDPTILRNSLSLSPQDSYPFLMGLST